MEDISKEVYMVPDQEVISLAKDLQRITWHHNYWSDWLMVATNRFWSKVFEKFPDANINKKDWYYDFDVNRLVRRSKMELFLEEKKILLNLKNKKGNSDD